MTGDADPTPRVTVVVCSLNGSRTIAQCLAALERQTIRADAQVVVVDDGSTDSTAEIAGTFPVEVVSHERNRGISTARNTGIARARAPVVAFTDDDCLPTERWLEELLAGYEGERVVAVGGRIDPLRDDSLVLRYLHDYNPLSALEVELGERTSLPSRLALYVRGMWDTARPVGARAVYSFAGANMSFRRDVLDAVGGFDDRMTFGADDEYICARARERYPDGLLWYEPDAVVLHDFVGTFRDLWRRNFAYGEGHARTFLLEEGSRWPIVFPVPVAVAATVLLAPRKVKLLAVLAVLVLLPHGIVGSRKHRRWTNLLFSYLRLAEETAHNAGMLAGLLAGRAPG